jgi:hypothetical protein
LQLEGFVADTSQDATLSFDGMMSLHALFNIVKQLIRKGVALGPDGNLKIGPEAGSMGGGVLSNTGPGTTSGMKPV